VSISNTRMLLIIVGLLGIITYFLYRTSLAPTDIDRENHLKSESTPINLIQPPLYFRQESKVYHLEGIIIHQFGPPKHRDTIWLINGEIRDLTGPDFRPAGFRDLVLIPKGLLRPQPKEKEFFSWVKHYQKCSLVTMDIVFCGHIADFHGPTGQAPNKAKILYKATMVYYLDELMAPYYLQ